MDRTDILWTPLDSTERVHKRRVVFISISIMDILMMNKNIEETTRERLGEGRFTMEQEVVNAKARTFSLCHQSICNVDNQHPHHSASIRSTYCLVLVLLTNKSIKVYIPLRKREASFFGQIMKERIIETTGNIRVEESDVDKETMLGWRLGGITSTSLIQNTRHQDLWRNIGVYAMLAAHMMMMKEL